ncbi:kinase-like domain-containing protein [Amanita rubescens]|nr:kinase-like domain-containing protein [Amanita rubescens]
MLKLVSTDVMPKSLFITGVKTNFDPIKVGGFGRVFRGKYKGREVALKIVDKGHRDDSLSQDFCREALAWRSLKHRFILPLLGIFEKKSQPYLVSPFMTNGTISDWRKKQEPPVLESEIHRLMLEVAEGLQYIHSEGIIHGDLHGGNVLLDSRFHCQITDFGSTRHFEATVTRSTKALSLNFAAPELFGLCIECGQTDCDGCYEGHEKQHSAKTMETDIYAFGCLYYAIFFDAVPFHEASSFQIMRLVMDGKRPLRLESPPMDTNTWNLVQSCWETIPSKRLKIEQIRKLLTLLD